MSINIPERTNYSLLFNSLETSSSSSLYGVNLSDYASIKNGSYGKLLKAYYTKDSTSSTSKTSSSSDTKKNNYYDFKKLSLSNEGIKEMTSISTSASSLQTSASKLIDKGTNSLFRETDITVKKEDGTTGTTRGYDKDAIYDAVNDFVNKYNSFIKEAGSSPSENINREARGLSNLVSSYGTSLNEIGITVNSDKSISVDETKFKEADISAVKKLFNGNSSFAYTVATRASQIGTNATSEANKAKSYTNSGTYSDAYSVGNLLNSLI